MSDRHLWLSGISEPRRRIIEVLRRSPSTINEVAAHLGVGYTAVRSHLAALQRDGLVEGNELRRGGTRPAVIYRLAPAAELALSQAYVPFAAELVGVLSERVSDPELKDVMGSVGRRLAGNWPRPGGTLGSRVKAASALLEELGAPNVIEPADHGWTLRGAGCLLAEAVRRRAAVCHAMEALLSELLDAPVRECCDRSTGRPQCCFEIAG
jgi:predicted ArsR family transcriptional regulator